MPLTPLRLRSKRKNNPLEQLTDIQSDAGLFEQPRQEGHGLGVLLGLLEALHDGLADDLQGEVGLFQGDGRAGLVALGSLELDERRHRT